MPSEGEIKTIYRFEGGQCLACQEMNGLYDERPGRPHENCTCDISSRTLTVHKVSESRELFDNYELLEPIDVIPKGGSVTVEQSWSTEQSRSTSGEISGERGGVGVSVGTESSESSSAGGGRSVTFEWSEEVGGGNQLVMAVYDVEIWRTTTVWQWVTPGGTAEMEFETFAHEEIVNFKGYYQEVF